MQKVLIPSLTIWLKTLSNNTALKLAYSCPVSSQKNIALELSHHVQELFGFNRYTYFLAYAGKVLGEHSSFEEELIEDQAEILVVRIEGGEEINFCKKKEQHHHEILDYSSRFDKELESSVKLVQPARFSIHFNDMKKKPPAPMEVEVAAPEQNNDASVSVSD